MLLLILTLLFSTVWLYLCFLPFQLTQPLGYLTVLAVGVAAFLYLGFLAAGEEMEQPFGKICQNSVNDVSSFVFRL